MSFVCQAILLFYVYPWEHYFTGFGGEIPGIIIFYFKVADYVLNIPLLLISNIPFIGIFAALTHFLRNKKGVQWFWNAG